MNSGGENSNEPAILHSVEQLLTYEPQQTANYMPDAYLEISTSNSAANAAASANPPTNTSIAQPAELSVLPASSSQPLQDPALVASNSIIQLNINTTVNSQASESEPTHSQPEPLPYDSEDEIEHPNITFGSTSEISSVASNKEPLPFINIPEKVIHAIAIYLPNPRTLQTSCKKVSAALQNVDFRIRWLKRNFNNGFKSFLIKLAIDCLRNSVVRDLTWKKFEVSLTTPSAIVPITYVPDLFSLRMILLSLPRISVIPYSWMSQEVCAELIEFFAPSLNLKKFEKSPASENFSFLWYILENLTFGLLSRGNSQSKPVDAVKSDESWERAEKLITEADTTVQIMTSLVTIAGFNEWDDAFKAGAKYLVQAKINQEQIQSLLPYIYQPALISVLRRNTSKTVREYLEILTLQSFKTTLETSSLFLVMLWASKGGHSWLFTETAVNSGISDIENEVVRFSSPILLSAVCSQQWKVAQFILSLLAKKNEKLHARSEENGVISVWGAMNANLMEQLVDDTNKGIPDIRENADQRSFELDVVSLLCGEKTQNFVFGADSNDGLLSLYFGRTLAEAAHIAIYTPSPVNDAGGSTQINSISVLKTWPGNILETTDSSENTTTKVENTKSKEEIKREAATALYNQLLDYAHTYFSTSEILKCYATMLSNARKMGLYTLQYCINSLKNAMGDVAVIFEAVNYFKDNSDVFSPTVFTRDVDAGYFLLMTSFSPYAGAIAPLIPNLKEKIEQKYLNVLETFLDRQLSLVSETINQAAISANVVAQFEKYQSSWYINLYGEECVSAPEILREHKMKFDALGYYRTTDKREMVLNLLSWALGIKGSEAVFEMVLDKKIENMDYDSVDVLVLAMKRNGNKIYCFPGRMYELESVAKKVGFDAFSGSIHVSFDAINAGFGNFSYEELRLDHFNPKSTENDQLEPNMQHQIPQLVRWKYITQQNELENLEFLDIPISFFQKNPPLTFANIHQSKLFVEIRRHFAAKLVVFTAFTAPLPMMKLLCIELKVDVRWLETETKVIAAKKLWKLSSRSAIEDEHLGFDTQSSAMSTMSAAAKSVINTLISNVPSQLEKSKKKLAPMFFIRKLLMDGIAGFNVEELAGNEPGKRNDEWWNTFIAAAAVGWKEVVDFMMKGTYAQANAEDIDGLVKLFKLLKLAKEEPLIMNQTKLKTSTTTNGSVVWLPDFMYENQKDYPEEKKTESDMLDVQEEFAGQTNTNAYIVLSSSDNKAEKRKVPGSETDERVRSQLYYYMYFQDTEKKPADEEKSKRNKILEYDADELVRAFDMMINRIADDEASMMAVISQLVSGGNGEVCVKLISAWKEKLNAMKSAELDIKNSKVSEHLSKSPILSYTTKFDAFEKVSPTSKSKETFLFGSSSTASSFTFSAPGETSKSEELFKNLTKTNTVATTSPSEKPSNSLQPPAMMSKTRSASSRSNMKQSKLKLPTEIEDRLVRILLESIEKELKICCGDQKSAIGVKFNRANANVSRKKRIENGLLYLLQHVELTRLTKLEGWELMTDIIRLKEGHTFTNPKCPGYSKCITRATIVSCLLWGGIGREWVDDTPDNGFFVPAETNILVDEEVRPQKQDVLRIIDSVRSCYQNQMPIEEYKSWNSGPPTVTQYLDPNAAATAIATVNAASSSLPSRNEPSAVFSVSSITPTKTTPTIAAGIRLKKRTPKPVTSAKPTSQKTTPTQNSFSTFNFNPSTTSTTQDVRSTSVASTFTFSGSTGTKFPVLDQKSIFAPKSSSWLFASFGTKQPRPQNDFSTPTLEGIPEYVHVEIFGYLSTPKDIGELSKVSKRLRELSKDRYVRLQWLLRHRVSWKNKFIQGMQRIESESYISEKTPLVGHGIQERTWKNLIYSASPNSAPFPAKVLDEEIVIAILRCHIDLLLDSETGSLQVREEKRALLLKAMLICAINRRQAGAYDEFFTMKYKDTLDELMQRAAEIQARRHEMEKEKKDESSTSSTPNTKMIPLEFDERSSEFVQKFIKLGIITGIVNNDAAFIKHIISTYGIYLDTLESELWKNANLAIGLGLWAAENGQVWVFADLNGVKSQLEIKESSALVLEAATKENENGYISEFLKRHCMVHWFSGWESIVRCTVVEKQWKIFDTVLQFAATSSSWENVKEDGPRSSYCADILIQLIRGLIYTKSIEENAGLKDFPKSKNGSECEEPKIDLIAPSVTNGDSVKKPSEVESKTTFEVYHRRLLEFLKLGLQKYPGTALFSSVILETIQTWDVEILKHLILYCIELDGEVDDLAKRAIDSPVYKFIYAYLNAMEDSLIGDVSLMLKLGLSIFTSYPFVKEIDSSKPAVFRTLEDSEKGFAYVLRNFVLESQPKLLTLMRVFSVWPMLVTHFFVDSYAGPVAEKIMRKNGVPSSEMGATSIVFFLVEMLNKFPKDVSVIMQILPKKKSYDQVLASMVIVLFWVEGNWEKVDKLVQCVNFLEQMKDDSIFPLFEQIRMTVALHGFSSGKSREFERMLQIIQDVEGAGDCVNFAPRFCDASNTIPPTLPPSVRLRFQSVTSQKAYEKVSFEELRLKHLSKADSSFSALSYSSSYFRPFVYREDLVSWMCQTITLLPEYSHLSVEEMRLEYYSKTSAVGNGNDHSQLYSKTPGWTIEEAGRLITSTSKLLKWNNKVDDIFAAHNRTSTSLEVIFGPFMDFIENLDLRGEIGGSLLIILINSADLSKNTWMVQQLISLGANVLTAPPAQIVKLMNMCLLPLADFFQTLARMLLFSVLLDAYPSFDRSLIRVEANNSEEAVANFIVSLIILGLYDEAWIEIEKIGKWTLKPTTLKHIINLITNTNQTRKDFFSMDEAKSSSSITLPLLYLTEKTLSVPVLSHDAKVTLPATKIDDESEIFKVDVKKVREFLKKLLQSQTLLEEESEKMIQEYFRNTLETVIDAASVSGKPTENESASTNEKSEIIPALEPMDIASGSSQSSSQKRRY
ncbi:hypothetical protein HK098_003654 [Nowakowskiella sp. JEL0407]|nr:hypothetical protein HK098_003654 [Nowakowskiella sp. JEL0407]